MKLKIYENTQGKRPFLVWLNDLSDKKARAIVRVRLHRIELGNFGDCKFVGKGVWELRIFYASGYRVYFGRDHESIIVLLSGGDKKSQVRDIKSAQNYWKEYKNAIV